MLHNKSNESFTQLIDVFIFNFIHCIDGDIFVLKNNISIYYHRTIHVYFKEFKFLIINFKNVQNSLQ
jgi:hypothetical protein